MTASASRPGGPAPGPSDNPAVQARRREAALVLGMDDAVARHFGETGRVEVLGKPLALHPLHSQPTGPWIASTRIARPAGMSDDAWCDALLLANSHSLLVAHAAFGLSEDGDAVLVLRVPPGHDDPGLLAVELVGLLSLADAVRDSVQGTTAATHSLPGTLQ